VNRPHQKGYSMISSCCSEVLVLTVPQTRKTYRGC
jgi:hypothetical protein